MIGKLSEELTESFYNAKVVDAEETRTKSGRLAVKVYFKPIGENNKAILWIYEDIDVNSFQHRFLKMLKISIDNIDPEEIIKRMEGKRMGIKVEVNVTSNKTFYNVVDIGRNKEKLEAAYAE